MSKIRFLLVLTILSVQILLPLSVSAQTFEVVVMSVDDGDQIRVKHNTNNLIVRLACIDAPEMGQHPWGQQAKSRLQKLLLPAHKVKIRKVGIDKYKRLIAEVFSYSNDNLNTNMVQEGKAVVYRQYLKSCSPKLQQSLLNAETIAKQRRLGIWRQDNPVMPWDFRRAKRTGVKQLQ